MTTQRENCFLRCVLTGHVSVWGLIECHCCKRCVCVRACVRVFSQEDFPVDYGPMFDKELEKLLWEFLSRMDRLLSVPSLNEVSYCLSLDNRCYNLSLFVFYLVLEVLEIDFRTSIRTLYLCREARAKKPKILFVFRHCHGSLTSLLSWRNVPAQAGSPSS